MGVAVHYGLGKHYDTLTPYQARMALKMLWVGFQITPSAEATAKISITIMLMRITTSKRWKYFFYALIVLIIFITVASLYSIMLSCHPVQMLWDPSVPGTCDVLERTVDIYLQGGKRVLILVKWNSMLIGAAVIAAGYDVILATSPILLLWNVQISPRSKWLLCGLLGLGFLYEQIPFSQDRVDITAAQVAQELHGPCTPQIRRIPPIPPVGIFLGKIVFEEC